LFGGELFETYKKKMIVMVDLGSFVIPHHEAVRITGEGIDKRDPVKVGVEEADVNSIMVSWGVSGRKRKRR